MNRLKAFLVKSLIPSNWIDWLLGRKRVLGVISLALWAAIYGVPAVYPEMGWMAETGLKMQGALEALGANFEGSLVTAGAGLTVVGLVDWILDHMPSRILSGALKKVEKPLKPAE